MNNVKYNLTSLRRVVLQLCLLTFFLFPFSTHAQYIIDIVNNDFVNFCEPIKYQIDIEKIFNTTLDELTLEVSFSEDIKYVSNDLGLIPNEISRRRITFNYPDLQNCNLQRGSLVIQASCYDVFETLFTSFTLKTPFVCLSESEQRVIVKSSFINIQFSDYRYDASSNQLLKTIELYNAGSFDINQFYILPVPDQQFATLESSDIGRMSNDTIFIENTSLKSNDSLSINILLNMNTCDLRSIDYEVGFICAAASCNNSQRFIDENDIYKNQVSAEIEQSFSLRLNSIQYGLCEAYKTPVSIKNEIIQTNSSIADIYNLEFTVNPFANSKRRFEECMVLSAQINNFTIPVNKVSDLEYTLTFESLITDPDGNGGLDDLDGDGQYDDLALNQKFDFDLELILSQMCHDNFQNLEIAIDTELTYQNFCRETFTRINGSDNDGFSSGNEIALFYQGSFPVIEALQLNESNKRFIQEGDILLLKYNVRPSPNMTRICETKRLQLLLDVPPTVEWDNSVEVMYYDDQDTVTLQPEVVNDSLLRLDFEEFNSLRSTLELSFISICDLNNTNYNAALSVCEQCVEYELPRFKADLSKQCDVNCNITIPVWESVSAPFFTKCESLPELIDPLVLGDIEYYNLSAGFIDDQESIVRDPWEKPSNSNNRFYFDGDTMLVQIPFAFECADELNAFSIQLSENQLSTYKFDILSSDVVLLNEVDNSEVNRCSANLFLNQSETAISFHFSESSFNLPCLDASRNHLLEVRIKFTYDCELNSNCGLLRLGVLQGITQVQLKNNCTRRVFYKKDTVHIHEVFKEEFFQPVDFGFGPQSLEIFDEFVIKTNLYSGLFTSQEFDPEYRRRPILRAINYTIPEGYKVMSDLIFVNKDFVFFNDQIQLFNDDDKIDTLLRRTLVGSLNIDGSTTYSFTDNNTLYYSDQLGDGLTAGLLIKSVCNPSDDIQTYTVDGIVEYVDYANGSLDTVSFPFSKTQALLFNPEKFSVEDDFQLLETEGSAAWTINKQVDFFTFDNFVNEDDRVSDEFIYRVEYKSKGMKIDSISSSLLVDQLLFDGTSEQIGIKNTYIGDSIIELELSPILLFADEEDSIFNARKPTQFIFHTSNHSCGFDTLYFEIGRKAEFLKDTCSQDIFKDFFVTYSPPGFPQMEWTDLPSEIKTFESNRLGFRLSNIGQGDLLNSKIVFENLPEAEYGLVLIEEDGVRTISNSIDIGSDLVIHLDSIGDGILKGLSNFDLSSLEFGLVFRDVCVKNKLFKTNVKTISQSLCGDDVVSPELYSGSIPIIAEDNLALQLNLNSFTTEECFDTASLKIVIYADGQDELDSPELHILVPKDLDSYENTLSINGVTVSDPISMLSEDKLSNTFVISDGLPVMITDSIVVQLKFDGSCIDVCRTDSVSTYLFSKLDQVCVDGNISKPLFTRAYTVDQKVRWKPNLNVTNIQTNVIGTKQEELEFELIGNIELTETPVYGGNVSITVFGDLNQNTILDPTDVIVKEQLISASEFNGQLFKMTDTLLIDPSVTCALHLIVDVDENCSCLFTSIPISQDGIYKATRSIQNCGSEPINIDVLELNGCQSIVTDYPGIISQENGAVIFQADGSVESDTLRFLTECMSCQFVEEIIIQNDKPEVEINLITAADCSVDAQVLWNGEADIPDDISIEWNVDNRQTSIISNPPVGPLIVELINQSGCSYRDTVMILSANELTLEVLSDEPRCSGDYPAIIDIVTEGLEPISILWNDGITAFQRMDIVPGTYQFTVTDGSGCSKIDTIDFAQPENLQVQSIVEYADCFNPTAGSIELLNSDQSLQYSMNGQPFSSENMFSNLSSGEYVIYLQNEEGCTDSITEQILLDTTFSVAIPLSQAGIFGDTLSLNPEDLNDDAYMWQWESADFELSCQSCPDPKLQLDKEGDVSFLVSNGVCIDKGLIKISAEFSDLFYVPNAFSRSSIKENDHFFIYPNASFDEVDLAIFDRWGNKLFSTSQVNTFETESGWDGTVNGKPADVGVYVYKAVMRRFADDLEIEVLGDFLLINN